MTYEKAMAELLVFENEAVTRAVCNSQPDDRQEEYLACRFGS